MDQCAVCNTPYNGGPHYIIDRDKLPPNFVETKLMGWGATYDKCIQCNTWSTLGDKRICQNCADQLVANKAIYVCKDCLDDKCSHCKQYTEIRDVDGICPICIENDNFQSTGQLGVCNTCYKELTLNNEGTCRNCSTQAQLKDELCLNCATPTKERFCKNCSKNLKICGECKDHFVPNSSKQVLCDHCRRSCIACSEYFDTNDKSRIYCHKCKGQIDMGICIGCKQRAIELNKYGRCEECEPNSYEPTSREFCPVCNFNEVHYAGQICNMCAHKLIKCPLCYNKTIPARRYICDDCKER